MRANVNDWRTVRSVFAKHLYGKVLADGGDIKKGLFDQDTPRARAKGQHEEQADADVEQNYAPQEVRHRVHKRTAQEQSIGSNEHLFGFHRRLFLRQ